MATQYELYETKLDAIADAHTLSHAIGMPAYAFDTVIGWQIGERKPTLRYGAVIECYQGREYKA